MTPLRLLLRAPRLALLALAAAALLPLGCTTAPAAAPTAARFPFEGSDVPVDPAVKWGRLDNGLRYALLRNPEPKGRASLRFAVAAGALNETEAQRGLAHYLEHLAFNGSAHFPAGTLVEYFQRLGLSFGGDTNASTGFDRTIYKLDLPDTKPETLEQALTLFADYAGGLRLDPAEITKERGIILSEKRARDSIGYRQLVAEYEFLLPGSRIPQRMPIGVENVINLAPREQFLDFYNTWYRPELITVVAVGDFDPAVVEPQLRRLLAPLAARAPARPKPGLGTVDTVRGVTVKFLPEPEAPAVTLAIETVTPYAHEPDTAANRLKYLPRSLALSILNRRFGILAKREGAVFLGGAASAGEQFDFFRSGSVDLSCEPGKWREALAVADQELRRALQYGFQPAELKEAVAQFRNSLEEAAKTAATRHSGALAEEITHTFIDREVFSTPAADLALYGPALDRVTAADCLAALRALWADNIGRRIFVTGNLKLDDAEKQIAAAYAASRAVAVAPPEKIAEAAFAYASFGPAGEVTKRQDVTDLGVTLLEFRNGVRLNLKPTDFEAGVIRVRVRVGGGELTVPSDKTGLALLAAGTFIAGGLGRHNADDLERILAGHTLGNGFTIGSDAFVFAGNTNRADLALQLQLLCAYLTDPGYRPEAERQFRQNLGPYYLELAQTVDGPLAAEVPRLLASGDARFGVPPQAAVAARTTAEVKTWLAPEFARGPVEIAIVGDFDPAAAIAAVAQTYGALPARAAKPAYEAERKVSFPAAPVAKTFTVPTAIPKGVVQLDWPATDGRDIHLARRLSVLASVFSDRLRVTIREKMGGTYSPDAGTSLSDTYRGYGLIEASATVAPDQARVIADAMKAVAAGLHDGGVTDEELVRAKQPMLTALRQSARTNGYWLGNVLASAQEFPEKLEWSRTRQADIENITAAELTALAKQYLDPARMSEFLSLPAPPK